MLSSWVEDLLWWSLLSTTPTNIPLTIIVHDFYDFFMVRGPSLLCIRPDGSRSFFRPDFLREEFILQAVQQAVGTFVLGFHRFLGTNHVLRPCV